METAKITLKTLAASILLVFVLETAYRTTAIGQGLPSLVGLGVLRLLEVLLLIAICLGIEKNVAAIGLASGMRVGFVKGLVWSACFAAVAAVAAGAMYIAGINPVALLTHPLPPAQARHPLVLVVVGAVIGPVAEEIFFRGIVYGFFRSLGVFAAVVFSTLLFVLPHLGGSVIPLTQAVGGIVFALAYEKEKSLLTPITIHCLGNLAIFSLAFIHSPL